MTGTWNHFWVASGLWLAVLMILECVRILPVNRLPWWIAHGPVLAWGGVALIPWFIALRGGVWLIPIRLTTVPLALPASYDFTLLALLGLAAGIIPFALAGLRGAAPASIGTRTEIIHRRAFFAIALLSAIYLASLSSLSRLWVLSGTSGENLYSGSNSSHSFLGLSLLVLAGLAISSVARQHSLSWLEVVLYLMLLLAAFGSAHRDLVMILVASYLILRNPVRRIRSSLIQKLAFLALGVIAVWLVGFGGLGQLSVLRSGIPASSPAAYTERTLASLDVMGSAEYLLESGVRPGQLGGASYYKLPAELVPRTLLGSKADPPAITTVQGVFGATAGASAPLWIEGVLNFGAVGDVLSMATAAGLWAFFLRKAVSSQSRLGRTAAAIGPVWILFSYQALSRILLIASIDVFASIILGILIWNWMQVETTVAPAEGVTGAIAPIIYADRSQARDGGRLMQ